MWQQSLSFQHRSEHSSWQLSNTAMHYDGHLSLFHWDWLLLPFPPLSSTQLLSFVVPHRSETLRPVFMETTSPTNLCSSQQTSGRGVRLFTVSSISWAVGRLSSSSWVCHSACVLFFPPLWLWSHSTHFTCSQEAGNGSCSVRASSDSPVHAAEVWGVPWTGATQTNPNCCCVASFDLVGFIRI